MRDDRYESNTEMARRERKELPMIRKYSPAYSGRFIEPFVGSGAVFFDTDAQRCCINDKSAKLINLYEDDFKITSFDKKYMVSFKNRNDRDTEHLIITHY